MQKYTKVRCGRCDSNDVIVDFESLPAFVDKNNNLVTETEPAVVGMHCMECSADLSEDAINI